MSIAHLRRSTNSGEDAQFACNLLFYSKAEKKYDDIRTIRQNNATKVKEEKKKKTANSHRGDDGEKVGIEEYRTKMRDF